MRPSPLPSSSGGIQTPRLRGRLGCPPDGRYHFAIGPVLGGTWRFMWVVTPPAQRFTFRGIHSAYLCIHLWPQKTKNRIQLYGYSGYIPSSTYRKWTSMFSPSGAGKEREIQLRTSLRSTWNGQLCRTCLRTLPKTLGMSPTTIDVGTYPSWNIVPYTRQWPGYIMHVLSPNPQQESRNTPPPRLPRSTLACKASKVCCHRRAWPWRSEATNWGKMMKNIL